MNKKTVIASLVDIANRLDAQNLATEADVVTRVAMQVVAYEDDFGSTRHPEDLEKTFNDVKADPAGHDVLDIRINWCDACNGDGVVEYITTPFGMDPGYREGPCEECYGSGGSLEALVPCDMCQGTGELDGNVCPECEGEKGSWEDYDF